MTMTSPMTSERTVMTLDTTIPIAITKGSELFDWFCEGWRDSKTIVNLKNRERDDMARNAYRAGQASTGARVTTFNVSMFLSQPKFTPAPIRTTGNMPVVTDAFDDQGVGRNENVTRVLEAWESDPETARVRAYLEFEERNDAMLAPFKWLGRKIKNIARTVDYYLDRAFS